MNNQEMKKQAHIIALEILEAEESRDEQYRNFGHQDYCETCFRSVLNQHEEWLNEIDVNWSDFLTMLSAELKKADEAKMI